MPTAVQSCTDACGELFFLCMHICIDMWLVMCMDVHVDLCICMCLDMCIDIGIDMCIGTCIEMCIHRRMDRGVDR